MPSERRSRVGTGQHEVSSLLGAVLARHKLTGGVRRARALFATPHADEVAGLRATRIDDARLPIAREHVVLRSERPRCADLGRLLPLAGRPESELSLTLQRDDASIPNLVAGALFGDGAAAVVMTGDDHPAAAVRWRPRESRRLSVAPRSRDLSPILRRLPTYHPHAAPSQRPRGRAPVRRRARRNRPAAIRAGDPREP